MTAANWDVFSALPGATEINFEKLCRALIRRHYGRFGQFKELANQAGVEFHLRLTQDCDLGAAGRWLGWQCKWYDASSSKALGATRRKKIQEGIEKSLKYLPELTDWILWTRYVLPKDDHEWFFGLQEKYPMLTLQANALADVEALLAGPAALLRESYFGELVLTPDTLAQLHAQAIAPIRSRWQHEVHQVMETERRVRLYLCTAGAWGHLEKCANRLLEGSKYVLREVTALPDKLQPLVLAFTRHVEETADLLREAMRALEGTDFEAVRQIANTDLGSPNRHRRLLSALRAWQSPSAIEAANLLADMHAARGQIQDLQRAVDTRLVAVVADAGDGKSELAIELTHPIAPNTGGVLLLGSKLGARQGLDDLASRLSISGRPISTFERLLEAVDAVGQRENRRIPVVIDGLNEAEDPRAWKDALSVAQVQINNYPHVLLIVTLRGEFAEYALPEGTEQLEINGFRNGDWTQAVERYFDYYKIDARDAELPEMLQHPLMLRIFCDITNHSRKHEVGVEAMPTSMVSLFEAHINGVATRIAEGSPAHNRLYTGEVREKLLKIGQLLWTMNRRAIGEKELREHLGDTGTWDQSIVRLLESEGILIRYTPHGGYRPEFAVVYDRIAGYLIAEHLVEQGNIDSLFNSDEKVKLMWGHPDPNVHPLAQDIFIALVGLYPHRAWRKQLWRSLPAPFQQAALLYAPSTDPDFIDRETTDALCKNMVESVSFSSQAFWSLRATRSAIAHPFDTLFLDSTLRQMSNLHRDLSWSEWLRKNLESVLSDVQAIEERWRDGQLDKREMLRARWVMWTLTTNVRRLRDISTRALYTLALRTPEAYFDLAIGSLSIPDVYVPERMLAAAYGAALSSWADPSAVQMREQLPQVARILLECMFLPGAPAPTRHALLRQYCRGLIELGRKVNDNCVQADELQYLSPPYSHLPSPFMNMPAVDEALLERADEAAIRMDFGNYTMGRLIPNRSNYDYNNEDYKKTRREIVQRMLELGYSPDEFEAVDRTTGSVGRMGKDDARVDRYGKKYAWIAYFEMWGWRDDHRRLPDYRLGQRPSDTDIDPTFPKESRHWDLKLADVFFDVPETIEEWMGKGPTPDYSYLLCSEEVDDIDGKWVLLDGFIEENAPNDDRQIFTFLRGVFVKKDKTQEILQVFKELEYPGNSAIPDSPEHYYTFAGEMTWAAPPESFSESAHSEGDNPTVGYNRWSEHPGVDVELPTQSYNWEHHHSQLNQCSGAKVPSMALCQALGLTYRGGKWDLYHNDSIASLYRKIGSEPTLMNGQLCYLRADLLARYLISTGQDLVWLLWGERGQHYRAFSHSESERFRDIYAAHLHIHKMAVVWSDT